MRWMWLTAPLTLALGLAVPPGALAAGGPVPPVQGHAIAVGGSPYRYAAFGAGGDTVVKVQEAGSGPAVPALRVRGHYGIPAVDYDGSTTGLSADGRTLILAELPGDRPPRTTRLLVLDTPRLAVRARLALPGFSTVDAISPDGRWLYLIHYPSSDISRYEVRAYDLVAHRMLAKPVVDPHDRDEAMTGFAMTRVMSADGRWAYTLYARPSGVPFVHALDTAGRRAVCIDLTSLSSDDIGNAHLRFGAAGATLRIAIAGVTHATIDTRTFAVRAHRGGQSASASVRTVSSSRRGTGKPGGAPWGLIAFSIVALSVLVGAGLRWVKPSSRPSASGEAVDAPSGAVGHWFVEQRRDQPQ